MGVFLAFLLLGLMVIVQSAIFSQVQLLYGTVDLPLLIVIAWAVQERVKTAWHWGIIGGLLVSLATAVPAPVILLAYVSATGIAIFLRRVFWQRPILAMISATFLATLLLHVITVAALAITGTQIPVIEAFYMITLPSALLNLLLAIPIYALIGDIANWLYPEAIEI